MAKTYLPISRNAAIGLGIVILMFLLSLFGLHFLNEDGKDEVTRTIAAEYFEIYKKRTDFDKFLSLYAEDMVLEDMVNGDRIIGKKAFAKFFSWDTPNLKRLDSLNRSLVLEELAVADKQIIAKGYFTPFQWYDTKYEAMQFTTWLFLNEEGKIIRHMDWINYPSNLIDYSKRKNSNSWIGK